MKRRLLATALSTLFVLPVLAQYCSQPAANFCHDAKFICGFALNGYMGTNYGYQNAPVPPDLPGCGIQPHNPQFFQIVPCSDQLSLEVIAQNCTTGDGLQVGLAESCDGPVVACDPGISGGANLPLTLSATVQPGEPYVLIIDGYIGDQCDFIVNVLEGMDMTPPNTVGVSQPGKIIFQSLPCGPATLTLQLPGCSSVMSAGCSSSWADFYSDECFEIKWNLPPGVQIISPNPNASTITIQFTQPVFNGMVSVAFEHTCPGISPFECSECIPGCCGGPIPPIFISGNPPTYDYVPCEEAPLFCAGSLDNVALNNGCSYSGFGWWQSMQWNWGNDPFCFPLEHPNLYRIIACNGMTNFSFEVDSCAKHKGLEFALLDGSGCGDLYNPGNCITIGEGQSGQLPFPVQYWPGQEYYLVVDGIGLDACDFKITEMLNGAPNDQQCLASQPSIDIIAPNYYTVSFDVTHTSDSYVTGGPGTLQFGYFMSAPIPCGTPYSFEVHTGSCVQTIAGTSPCYLPPDCPQFNFPAALADSCHEAPLFCGNYLENYCSTTSGLTPDQPAYATGSIPLFENNGWLRIAPCSDSIVIDFQVFDCESGSELEFFLLSGNCDTMTLLASASGADGDFAHLTAQNLIPNDIYYLSVDGVGGAECKFQVHVVEGIGTASPGTVICDCTDSHIAGPSDICPGDFAAFSFVPGFCTATVGQPPIGGNGIFCPPPMEACPDNGDSVVMHWVIPGFLDFLSDSINVPSILTQADTNFIGYDTVMTGTVTITWEVIDLPPYNSDLDTNIYCDCFGGCTPGFTPKDVTLHHEVEVIHGVLTCVEPCYIYNGQLYCAPGQYIAEQTNCKTTILVLTGDFYVPFASAGPDKTICPGQSAVIGGNSSTGPSIMYSWSNGGPLPQQTVAPPITTTYALIVTNASNGCTDSDEVTVVVAPPGDTNWGTIGTLTCSVTSITFPGNGMTFTAAGNYTVPKANGCGNDKFIILSNYSQPSVSIPPVPPACPYDEVTLTANGSPSNVYYNWSNGTNAQQNTVTVGYNVNNTYTVTVTNPVSGCTNTATATVSVQNPINTFLPVQICEGDCFYVAGEMYCPTSGGNMVVVTESYQGCDSVIFVTIFFKPYNIENHGVVGELTCTATSVNFMGHSYNQPGNYVLPDFDGCGEHQFSIVSNTTPPSVDAGASQVICNGKPVMLTATSGTPGTQFSWSNGNNSAQVTVSPTATTTYQVVATNPVSGCTASDQVTVEVLPPIPPTVLVPVTICEGDCIDVGSEVYCPTSSGTYSSVVQSVQGCDSTVVQAVTIQPKTVNNLGVVGTLTCAQPCVTFNGQQYCQPGTYSFTENCEIKQFQIGENLTLPVVQLGTVGTLTCAQPCVTFNGQQYCQPGTYSFTENCEIKEFQIGEDLTLPVVQLGTVGTLTCAQPCVTFNGQQYCQPGTYSVTENCEVKEFEIDDLPSAWLELGEDQTIAAGESTELVAQTNAQPILVNWQSSAGGIMPDTTLEMAVEPLENTLYSLKIQDINGCTHEDSIWVFVQKAEGGWFVPNVIRPGSAGPNGWFTIFSSPGQVAEIQLLEIYDRWGSRVFARENFPPNLPEMGWDGTQNGKIFDPAVFVWRAVLLLDGGELKYEEGDVTVLR